MTNFNLIFLFFIQQSITQNPPVVPLTSKTKKQQNEIIF